MRKRNPKKKSSHSLVRGIRALKGLSQGALAKRLGCSQAQISRWEQQQVSLPKKDAGKIAKALGVTPETLFPHIEAADDVSDPRGGN